MSENATIPNKDIFYIMTYLTIGLIILNLLSIIVAENYPGSNSTTNNQSVVVTITEHNIIIDNRPHQGNSSENSQLPFWPNCKWLGTTITPILILIVGGLLLKIKKLKDNSNFTRAAYVAIYGIIISIVLPLCFLSFDIVPFSWSVVLIVLCWAFVFINKFSFISSKIDSLPNNACAKIQLFHEGLKTAIGHTVTVCLTLGLVVATMMTILWALQDKPHNEKTYISLIIVFGFVYSYLGIGLWVARYLWSSIKSIYEKA